MIKAKIRVYGTIQGVGFRPFIYKKAIKFKLNGFVLNDSLGVLIEIEGNKENIELFLKEIRKDKPRLSKIDKIEIYISDEVSNYQNFEIKKSLNKKNKKVIIPIDSALCSECLSELNDKNNFRYNYPFINCINCGPRYTIIKSLPYDRINTSMSKFKMCKECQSEYEDEHSRRFHAEPISCPNCGLTLSLLDKNFNLKFQNSEAIKDVIKIIKDGKIIAIKGYGGFHLICNGLNEESVKSLRDKKNRKRKPFALMFKNIEEIKKYTYISRKEEEILNSPSAPILLVQKKNLNILNSVAPNIDKLGVFLPYTPLHYLILKELSFPLIVTSANISHEPIISDIEELRDKNLYDYILDYDRDIINPCDDSVMMVVENREFMLRRGRGYAPSNIEFNLSKNVLALGANQKSSIAIGFDNNIILSPYIGDLNSIKSIELFKKSIDKFKYIYNFKPDVIVCDKHPNYESTKFAKNQNIKVIQIQHHYAHTLSVMAEHNLNKKVLATIWDGSGLGDDENLWGGEFFIADLNGYERILHFDYLKLLGGEKAIKEPRRIALSILFDIYGKDAMGLNNPTINSFSKLELNNLYMIYYKNLNSIKSSSVGRLFDAVASISGVLQKIDYEGESGAILENFYDKNINLFYEFKIENNIVKYKDIFTQMLKDKEPKIIISKFINSLVELIIKLSYEYDLPMVFSGGVFQNRVLLELIIKKLKDKRIYFNGEIPSNDGGISLGQTAFFKNRFL